MSNKVINELEKLVAADVITEEVAINIRNYYSGGEDKSQNRLFLIFAVLGALLVGSGIILIIAHNWDDFPRSIKTFFAVIILLIAQGLCAYTLLKKRADRAWEESSSTFLFFAFGASIALLSQIYNLPGNVASFLLSWLLFCFPIMYVMKSSMASILHIVWVTFFVMQTGFHSAPEVNPNWYWLLLGLGLPYYYQICQEKPNSNYVVFHHWLYAISLAIAIGTIGERHDELMLIVFSSLFGLYYLVGHHSFFESSKIRNNAYLVIGSLGTIVLLLLCSFYSLWEEFRPVFNIENVFSAPELWVAVVLTLLAGSLFIYYYKNKSLREIEPIAPIFLLFIPLFTIGMFYPIVAAVLVNGLLFAIGLLITRKGTNMNHMGVMNYGLLIITVLIICRFFDVNIPFYLRGSLFVLVGVGFFLANSRLLQKRKNSAIDH